MGSKLDITGQTFGWLTAIEPTDKRVGSMVVWKFQCECGNIVEKPAARVRSGNTKSCGCKKSIGLVKYNQENAVKIDIGQRFGKLTVIENLGFLPYGSTGKNRTKFLCQCDCGNKCEAWGNQLLTNNKKSCGCITSRGEEKIIQLLKDSDIVFLHDTCFEQLKNETGRSLRFDFILFLDNGIRFIEFDGRQHYMGMDTELWANHSSLEEIKEKDRIKDDFCKKHNYPLVRIPYHRLEKLCIDDILGNKYLVK